MKQLIPAIILTTAGLGLAAQSTGVISGTVKDAKGAPIAGATILLKRVGMEWNKSITTGEDGKFMQVGLDPREYDIEVSAPGFVPLKLRERIRVSDPVLKDFVLYTPQEAAAKGVGGAQPDPGAVAENAGLQAFNDGVTQFNAKAFTEALPNFETAYKHLSESIAKTKASSKGEIEKQGAQTEQEKKFATVERVYGFTLAEVAKIDPDRQTELNQRALPLLKAALARDPKDQNALIYLVEALRTLGETAEADKYQAELDKLIGPNPGVIYNQAVEAFNAGKMKEARPFLQKVLQIDPKFAEAYYLLAMCDYADMNLKSTKQNLQKYLEVAPNGKNAAEAQAMLADPSLKNIK